MSTSLPIDHVVIAVRDLERTIADYRTLGFTVAEGGRHPPPRRSKNALVIFEDGAYLELIAWEGEAPAEAWWCVLDAHGEGFVDFALLPSDTTRVLEAAQARGLMTLTGPLDGARLRPDGELVQWQTARHITRDLPFLCGDITPRRLRVAEGAVRTHANGVRGIAGIDVAVHDLDASLARYRALLGNLPDGLQVAIDNTRGVRGARVDLSGSVLTLLSPLDCPANPAEAGIEGRALRARLATRGEGPWRLRLHGPSEARAGELDPQRTHSAIITLS